MHPVIHLFGRAFGTYGLCAFVGFILAFLVVWRLAKRYGNTIDDVLLLGISIGVGLFLGGHLLYAITRADLVVKAFGDIGREPVRVWYVEMVEAIGGMVFYGGFLGGLGGLLIFTRFYRDLKRENALDLYAVATPLFHTFGRIGCFFGGCCFGKESDWGFLVRENRYYPEMVGVVRIPVQLIESGCNLLLFVCLFVLFLKRKAERELLWVYLTAYPVIRFTLEFWRGDTIRGVWFGLSTSQWISLALFIAALVHWILRLFRKPAKDAE